MPLAHYTETRIEAVGRVFVVEVFDRADEPFEVSYLLPDGIICKLAARSYANRSKALQEAARRACAWIEGNADEVDR
jgi:hypothetical protein